jgi:predicted RNA binding protein with dsRBD fold (UPF0201 family)
MEITISTPIMASEDKGKVLDAVMQIFPTLRFDGDDTISAESSEREVLNNLRELIKKQEIKATVRPFLTGRINGDTLHFSLNKQAASMGYVNLTDFEQSLGSIDVEIKDEAMETLVDWLCD